MGLRTVQCPCPAQLDSPKNTQGGAAVQDACRAGCVPTASPAGSVRCDGGRGTRGAGEAAFSEGSDLRSPLNPHPTPAVCSQSCLDSPSRPGLLSLRTQEEVLSAADTCCHPVAAGGMARAPALRARCCDVSAEGAPRLPAGAQTPLGPCVCARPLLRHRLRGWRRGPLCRPPPGGGEETWGTQGPASRRPRVLQTRAGW